MVGIWRSHDEAEWDAKGSKEGGFGGGEKGGSETVKGTKRDEEGEREGEGEGNGMVDKAKFWGGERKKESERGERDSWLGETREES